MPKPRTERIAEAQKEGRCDAWIGPHPDGRVDGGIHHGPILLRCSNPPLPDDHYCTECKELEEQGMHRCTQCGKPTPFVTDYAWKAVPGQKRYGDQRQDWIIFAVTQCCGAQANTEELAIVIGWHSDAKKRTEEIVKAHNATLAPAYEQWKTKRQKAEGHPLLRSNLK